MRTVLSSLNGTETSQRKEPYINYDTCCGGTTKIKCASGDVIPASEIKLGTPLTQGTVYGTVIKECKEICLIKGHCLTPGTAVWCDTQNKWMRACDIAPVQKLPFPAKCYSFVVSPSACIETDSGLMFRDYVEVHSPETEKSYAEALNKEELPALR
jgi:hypothetical protein